MHALFDEAAIETYLVIHLLQFRQFLKNLTIFRVDIFYFDILQHNVHTSWDAVDVPGPGRRRNGRCPFDGLLLMMKRESGRGTETATDWWLWRNKGCSMAPDLTSWLTSTPRNITWCFSHCPIFNCWTKSILRLGITRTSRLAKRLRCRGTKSRSWYQILLGTEVLPPWLECHCG